MKILSKNKETIKYRHEFWDWEEHKYIVRTFTVERNSLGNHMSGEFAHRHGLDKA